MKKKILNSKISVNDEIRHFSNDSDVRAMSCGPTKAAYILLNYCGEIKISKNALAKFFKISISQIEKAAWKLLCGYTDIGIKQPRYLAPIYEALLREYIENSKENHQSVTKDQIQKKVKYLLSYSRHMIFGAILRIKLLN